MADCYFWNQAYYSYLGQKMSAGLFKEGICHICKKEAVYDSQKNVTQKITVCFTETSENIIKKFTDLKNEVPYREVQCDLIAEEFLYHEYCYNILIKPVYSGKKLNDNNCHDSEGDFIAFENFILSNVLENHQFVSMKTLTSL